MFKKYFNFVLAFWAINFLITDLNGEKVVVTIDELVKTVDEKESLCAFDNWGKKLENSCTCCIVKNANKVFSGELSGKNAIEDCVKFGSCNSDIIGKLMPESLLGSYKNKKAEDDVYKKFINYIYDKSVVVKSVDSQESMFDSSGNFKDGASVAKFLQEAYKEGKLKNKSFESVTCIAAKDMVEEKSESQWGTAQLFLVNSNCPGKETFILKEIKRHESYDPIDEIYRLSKTNKFKPLEDYIYPKSKENFPQIFLPVAYFSYTYKNEKHYLVLMNAAPGFMLFTLIQKFKANPNDQANNDMIAKAYYDVGRSMANFYKKFMVPVDGGKLGKSIIHEDFHHKNIFYDPISRKVSIIDNERLSNTIDIQDRQDIAGDIDLLLMASISYTKLYHETFFDNFDLDKWLNMTLSNFITGFLSSYSKEEIKSIIPELKNRIINKSKYTEGGSFYDDVKEYQALKNKNLVVDFFNNLESKSQEDLEKIVYRKN